MSPVFSDYIAPFLLAILQGVTEFLPISSSGHLILLHKFMPVDAGLLFDLVLHLATLISVVAFYFKDIAQICRGCFLEFHAPNKTNLKFVALLLLATAITAALGLLFKDAVESHFRSLLIVGALLILNAAILWLSKKRGILHCANGKLNLKTAILIGVCQGFAVLPGISRSGTTITAALLAGIQPHECAKISFLLSIPVILGAVILHIPEIANMQCNHVAILLAAATLAAAVGYASLFALNKILKRANFHHFSFYCITVGILAIAAHYGLR